MKQLIANIKWLFVAALLVILPKPVRAVEEFNAAAQLRTQVVNEDSRVAKLRKFLASHNSPLSEEAAHFVAEADRLNLDWRLVAAIAGVESTFGKFIPANSYNGWGWGVFTGQQDGIHFDSWKDGITQVSEGLRLKYIDKGATTIEAIGHIYAASGAWPWKVRFFLNQIEDFQPKRTTELDITI